MNRNAVIASGLATVGCLGILYLLYVAAIPSAPHIVTASGCISYSMFISQARAQRIAIARAQRDGWTVTGVIKADLLTNQEVDDKYGLGTEDVPCVWYVELDASLVDTHTYPGAPTRTPGTPGPDDVFDRMRIVIDATNGAIRAGASVVDIATAGPGTPAPTDTVTPGATNTATPGPSPTPEGEIPWTPIPTPVVTP